MNYVLLKYFHILCVASSFALFFIRGIWVLRAYPPSRHSWERYTPHIVDTLLLGTGLTMLSTAGWGSVGSWLGVKLVLVIVYIWFGLVALRLGKTRTRKSLAWIGAMALFLFITTVAMLHNPLGIFSLLFE